MVNTGAHAHANEPSTPHILDGTSLDILLGRKGPESSTSDLDQLLHWSPSNEGGARNGPLEDLTSFSLGGDIFGEIAAAAAADHERSTLEPQSTFESREREQDTLNFQAASMEATASHPRSVLLPAHDISEGSTNTPTLSSDPSHASQNNIMDPDWVPKVSSDGQIFYYNTRTGKRAHDLPSPSTSSNASRQLWSGSGTATSDKSKWTSGGTSVSAHHDVEDSGRKISHSTGEIPGSNNTSSASTQRLSADSSVASSSAPLAPVSRANAHREASLSSRSSSRPNILSTSEVTGTTRKASVATQRSASTAASKRQSTSTFRRLDAVYQAIKPTSPPYLVQLERQCMDALSRLSAAVQKRSEVYDQKLCTDMQAFSLQECSSRDELVEASIDINNATRQLLAMTDVILEQPQHSRGSSSRRASLRHVDALGPRGSPLLDGWAVQILPSLPIVEFRPLAMKITATESKLMLSIRTAWGLLATSPDEETAVNGMQMADNYSEEEMLSLRRQQNIQLASRKDIDTKLIFDLLVQIRTLGDAISTFLEQVEAFAQKNGCTVTKNGLQLSLPAKADFRFSPEDILLPVAASVGNMHGHGFEHYFAKGSRTFRSDQDFKASSASRARRVLCTAVLQDLSLERKALLDDLSALRAILGSIMGGLRQPSMTPSLVSTTTAQITAFVNRLGRFLRQLEDIDIAASLDVDLDDGKRLAQGSEGTPSQEEMAYLRLLKEASTALRDFTRTKGLLYSVPANMLLLVQKLVMQPTCFSLGSMASPLSQPKDGSPLGCCWTDQVRQLADNQSIVDVLEQVDVATERLLFSLSRMRDIADQQSQAPLSLRQHHAQAQLKGATHVQKAQQRQYNHDEDDAEELERSGVITSSSGSSAVNLPGQRISMAQSSGTSEQLARTPSNQSFNGKGRQSRGSRSNSVADSLRSDISRFSDYSKSALDDPRMALLDANLRGKRRCGISRISLLFHC